MSLSKDEIERKMKAIHVEVEKFIRSISGFENYRASLKMDWSNRRVCSRGGLYKDGPGVNYAMSRLVTHIQTGLFEEYKSFSQDTTIGSVKTPKWELICYALSCHEQAHAAMGYLDKSNKEGHGSRWKDMYRILRNKFVNPFLRKKWEVDKSANTIAVVGVDTIEDQEMRDLKLHGPANGIHAKHIGKEFTIGPKSERVAVIGWNTRAHKYPVILERKGQTRKYVMSPFQVINAMKVAGVY